MGCAYNAVAVGSIPTTRISYTQNSRKGAIFLDYCIKNNRNIFIKLNDQGSAVTCVESVKGIFEYSKARNILASLPKSLKKMNFKLEAIPEIKPKEEIKDVKVLENQNYTVSEDISRWIDKFGTCSDILEEAKQREDELISALDNVDKEFLNILHAIELEKSKDMYSGWQEYKHIKENREKRRRLKDELLIVQSVLKEIKPDCLNRKRVQKAVDGLLGRKYTFRVVEEDGTDEIL